MKLQRSKIKKILPKICYILIFIGLALFFGKTYIWERDNLIAKTGTARATNVVGTEVEAVEVDETEPTPQEIIEYTVPAGNPRYISIPSIGNVNQRQVISVGLTKAGALDTPINIFQAGWYNQSAKPGTGGTVIIDGHNGGPNVIGIFKHLPNAKLGEKVIIENGAGQIFTYTIVKNDTIPLAESDNYMKEIFRKIDGKETLTVITCTGEWSQTRQTYLSRQYLRATLDGDTGEKEKATPTNQGVQLNNSSSKEAEKTPNEKPNTAKDQQKSTPAAEVSEETETEE